MVLMLACREARRSWHEEFTARSTIHAAGMALHDLHSCMGCMRRCLSGVLMAYWCHGAGHMPGCMAGNQPIATAVASFPTQAHQHSAEASVRGQHPARDRKPCKSFRWSREHLGPSTELGQESEASPLHQSHAATSCMICCMFQDVVHPPSHACWQWKG
jgi:hypothetical protein